MLLLLATTPAKAELDEAGQAGASLLRLAITPRQDGAHEALLAALRRLHDPTLKPFFDALVAAPQASLQLHGLLGLAELDPKHQLPISAIGEIDYAPLQAELIAAAMDADLLSIEDAKQLLDWPGLAMPVKLIVATRLMAAGAFDRPQLLAEALRGEKLGQRGLAALMLHQMGDPRGIEGLSVLDQSTEEARDAVRSELLRTAVQHRYQRAADWALGIANEPNVDERLAWSGLAAAMRFGLPSASATWKQMYVSLYDNPAKQRLLALMALRVAPFVKADTFDVLLSSDDALVADIGRTGKAIAGNSPDLIARAQVLLEHRHAMVNDWALAYADGDARPDVAQQIALIVIRLYEPGAKQDRVDRLDDAAQAARRLMEVDPIAGGEALRPILAAPETDEQLKQAILTALLRVEVEGASKVIDGLTFDETDTGRLALLLRARDGATLTDKQMAELAWIVRGATKLQGTLRMQATWIYLERTNQIDAALAAALQP